MKLETRSIDLYITQFLQLAHADTSIRMPIYVIVKGTLSRPICHIL